MNAAVFSLVYALIQLCLCRVKPEVLPYSVKSVGIFLLLTLLSNLYFLGHWAAEQILWLMFSLGTQAGFLWILLWVRDQSNRFLKLFLAFLGTHFLLAWGLWLLILAAPDPAWAQSIALLGTLWVLAVNSHIFQYGLGVSRFRGILMALAFISFQVLSTLPFMPRFTEGAA